jgi:adenine-specific DNA methylase
MLGNGLGLILEEMAPRHSRFIDLFTGSGSVAWFVSQRFPIEARAHDLQHYACALAAAVIERSVVIDPESVWKRWLQRASPQFEALDPPSYPIVSASTVEKARNWCEQFEEDTFVYAFGGHYYSPLQVSWITALRFTLPKARPERSACLAALIIAASKCAASPGHTAQPFQPTFTAIKYLQQSWGRDFCCDVLAALRQLGPMYAKKKGCASVADANESARSLRAGDLVFIDPPYSAVQYSRFYHVLESIAVGAITGVEGVGRYPPIKDRPSSKYSQKSTSFSAVEDLLISIENCGASAIVTFPNHLCSNGIDAASIVSAAKGRFQVAEKSVRSLFSTLGGPSSLSGERRIARVKADEIIICLEPK